jgi:hypothetical protein
MQAVHVTQREALAEFETSPAFAFIFSSPIMNSNTAHDRVTKLWLGEWHEMVAKGSQEAHLLTIDHLDLQTT